MAFLADGFSRIKPSATIAAVTNKARAEAESNPRSRDVIESRRRQPGNFAGIGSASRRRDPRRDDQVLKRHPQLKKKAIVDRISLAAKNSPSTGGQVSSRHRR